VIGVPSGAAPELIEPGGGILVPHDDPAAMAQAIKRVCSMSDREWRTMSDAAYRTASGFTWEDAATLFEAALKQAIERQPAGAVA
jgi:glycosyltransferase involved in cell wall biosynthesis